MNKDEILAASDAELDEWCAKTIMGWITDRDHWHNSDEYIDPKTHKSICWIDNYGPTTNIEQAIGLLDHLAEQQFFNSIYSNVDQPHRVSVGKRGEWGWYNGSCEDKSRSRAIVVACLLALADVEELEQQTAAAPDAAQEGAG